MAYSLVISSTYKSVEVAIAQDGTIIEASTVSKKDSSKLLIPEIDVLLRASTLSLDTLDYLTVNRGPSPFTTLRVVLTTVNGIAFARGTSIVGIDGLTAFISAHIRPGVPLLVLLNAYNNDAYYALSDHNNNIRTGCMPIIDLLRYTHETMSEPVTIIGNGVSFFVNQLAQAEWKNQFVSPKIVPEYVSIEAVAKAGYHEYMQGNVSNSAMPLYLK